MSDSANLARSVVVTGGGHGIGAATARCLIERDWQVVVLERDLSDLELSESDQLVIVEGDARSRTRLDEACARAADMAPLAGFVANAGYNLPGATATLPRPSWDEVLEVNLSAVYEGAQAAFSSRGTDLSIVMVSSLAGLLGLPGRAAYGAAKAGIGGLVRALAVEWGGRGVRVNAICPGFTRTRLHDLAVTNGTLDPEAAHGRIPMGRWAAASEMATVVAFLLSSDASYVNGVMFPVDGGATIQLLPATEWTN